MKCITRLYFINDNGDKFFGEGPYRLIKLIDETGSLRQAAEQMSMAYTKALKLLKRAETALGFKLTERQTGGSKGGGSILTSEGREWINKYEQYREACNEANSKLYMAFFESDK